MIYDKLAFTAQKSSHYIAEILNGNSGFKVLGVVLLTVMSWFFDPELYKELIISIAVLPIIDYITGVLAAAKRGEKVKSRGFYGSIVKICTYGLVIAGLRAVEAPLPELAVLDNLGVKAIAITEIWSIIENFDKMGYVKNKKLKELIRGVKKQYE